MSFDLERFRRADLAPRSVEVKLASMKDWFGEDEPIFRVRGLTGAEVYRVEDSVRRRKDQQAILEALSSGIGEAMAQACRENFGDDMPDRYIKIVETIYIGCVEPALERTDVLKLGKHYPTQMSTVFVEIMRATGEGAMPGESKGCGEIPASATTSTSPTCAESASSS